MYRGKDDCGLKLIGNTTRYKIEKVNRDISCVAAFELQPYKFTLTSSKGDAVSPNPDTINYKMGKGFFYDYEGTRSITKLTTNPTITGYLYDGYNYKNDKIIDASGNITQVIPSMDYSKIEQELTANLTAIKYNITYDLGGGSNCGLPTTATYDENVVLCTPTKTGYTFSGWMVTSGLNTSTAKYGSGSTNVNTSLNSSSTLVPYHYFKNLTAANNVTVTIKANYTPNQYKCSAGYYLKANDISCTQCPVGSYCSGGTYTFSETAESGRNQCPTNYSTENAGSTAKSQCRKWNDCKTGSPNECVGGYVTGYQLRSLCGTSGNEYYRYSDCYYTKAEANRDYGILANCYNGSDTLIDTITCSKWNSCKSTKNTCTGGWDYAS